MKVIHIIPSAFNYFDDIRNDAFRLIDGLSKLGIENEAITIQFGASEPEEAPSKESGAKGSGVGATSRPSNFKKPKFLGTSPIHDVVSSFANFDIIHAHCPLFGAASKVLTWKKKFPEQPLIITYYRRVRTPDWTSLLVVLYNAFYLPKLFAAADIVTARSLANIPRRLAKKTNYLREVNDDENFFGVELPKNILVSLLTVDGRLAMKYIMLYNSLTS